MRKNQKEWDLLKDLPIGTKVMVFDVMVDEGSPEKRPMNIDPKSIPQSHRWVANKGIVGPFEAWVSGATWLCDGTIKEFTCGVHGGSFSMELPDSYRALEVTKKTPVLLVRKFMFGKEIAVPIGSVKRMGENDQALMTPATRKKLFSPILKFQQPSMDDRVREELRVAAASFERDRKGRFAKYSR